MNSSHYPSLELCKKLTPIGFPDTEKKWYKFDFDSYGINSFKTEPFVALCPSVIEMLDEMPTIINDDKQPYLVKYKDGNYSVKYWSKKWGSDFGTFDTLPNALAEMILWLHENNYISFSK